MWKRIRSSKTATAIPVSRQLRFIATATAVVCMALLICMQTAMADPLDKPRADGIVGERYDGYAAMRKSGAPANVVALVRTINRQRRDYYKKLAQKEGVSPAEVGKVYANKIYQSAPRGYWFLSQSGQWQRKF